MELRVISALIDVDRKLRFSFLPRAIINMLMSDENYSSVRHFRRSIFKDVFAEIEGLPFFVRTVVALQDKTVTFLERSRNNTLVAHVIRTWIRPFSRDFILDLRRSLVLEPRLVALARSRNTMLLHRCNAYIILSRYQVRDFFDNDRVIFTFDPSKDFC